MPEVDIQQVCLNGHQMTDRINRNPEKTSNFCPHCGQATIIQCPSCESPIIGSIFYKRMYPNRAEAVPAFCGNCGEAYPWTKNKIENFSELADELEELSVEDREKLKLSLDELIRESPKTEVASLRFKKIAAKLGNDSYEVIKKVATDIVSEAVRKTLYG